MTLPANRRAHPRHSRRLLVEFRILGGTLPPDSEPRTGRIVNISRSGMILDCRRPLKEGAVLEVEIPETVLGRARTLQARVIWLKPGASPGQPLMGCEFITLTREEKLRVRMEGLHVPEGERVDRAPDWILPTTAERRRAARQEMRLKIRVLDAEGAKSGRWQEATLEDFSTGGAQISTRADAKRGDTIELDFPESPLGKARRVRARVQWRSGAQNLGCTFLE